MVSLVSSVRRPFHALGRNKARFTGASEQMVLSVRPRLRVRRVRRSALGSLRSQSDVEFLTRLRAVPSPPVLPIETRGGGEWASHCGDGAAAFDSIRKCPTGGNVMLRSSFKKALYAYLCSPLGKVGSEKANRPPPTAAAAPSCVRGKEGNDEGGFYNNL